ncbi:hypothetical protein TNIN_209021 [Trichonephila inaurata madagascariensis]|uniref:Uncharacterized protein n=1 Tax=Trichonephila inaurata madagascariensis TaxID=2747483 RepID=A0A8X6X5D9_9ARAC|nr:hypothetical protein TNIN_102511 [Trichonephila inaurata madagascariensis]GFY53247.1 hypothetical protein TNIN_209021 [Trichonephila inaurata madagascariensis]
MNQDTTEKMILFAWMWFTIKFLFFSYWEIMFWPPIILLLHGSLHFNTLNKERIPGDSDPKAFGRTTQEDSKFKESYEHSSSLDKLIRKLIEEEKERILKKQQVKFSDFKKK